MEEEAQALLATLRKSSIPVDTKLAAFNKIKSDIKHLRVPESCQATIFECIRLAISSQTSATLVSTGFGTLGHLVKRLSLQEQTAIIAAHTTKLLPILLDRLGDPRESNRNAALQSLADLWPYNHDAVEKTIKEGALSGNHARAKEMGMLWVVKVHREQGLQFRTFVPFLVANLEDADAGVRETAKSVVVELFSNAPERAKTDLKKQMTARGVRKTIEAFIISQLGLRNLVDVDMAASSVSMPAVPTMSSFHSEPEFGESSISDHHPPQETLPMDPLYVHTQRELEDIFRDMAPHFEGKETEHNWMARDKNVTKLRRLIAGNAAQEFRAAFVAGIKSLTDGILKVANSLRTTVSTNGCQLVQEIARALGPAIDSSVEILMQNFIKMSANTKPIAANNGNVTVETIISHVTYHPRLMQHLWISFQDKNVQTRSFAAGWLRSLIKKHARNKALIEHAGGLDLVEKCLKKGLADANPKVRESTRATYWAFAQVWPEQAEAIMATLDAKSKQLLEKDANNPNAGSLASSVSSVTSVASKPKPGAFNGRQSVREAIAAQRRAAMAAKIPERPTSAQSILSPASTTSAASVHSRPLTSRSAAGRAGATSSLAANATSSNHAPSNSASGSLMAAPVRRPRRPELTRPATADPYAASRRAGNQATPTMSPNISPSKSKTSTATKQTTTSRTPARPPLPATASTIRSKSRTESHLPRPSPRSRRGTGVESPMSTPSREDNFTMVNIPFTRPPDDEHAFGAPSASRSEHTQSFDGSIFNPDEDNFTIVNIQQLPNLRKQAFDDYRPPSSDSAAGRKSATPRPSPVKLATEGVVTSPLVSPIRSRLRSPMVRPPQSSADSNRSPDAQARAAPVQIYEDPFTATQPDDASEKLDKLVLEELPHNERAPERAGSEDAVQAELGQSTRSNEQNIEVSRAPRTPRSHYKTTSSGSIVGPNDTPGPLQSQAELLRSRRLLASGLERIRTKTLEVHGFRKLQELVKSKDIWGDDGQQFGELLIALLDYLESPNEALKAQAPKATTLKAQVLSTVRAMLALHKREAAPYYSRALCSVLATRRQFDDASHISAEIEKTAAEIVRTGQPADCLHAVLDLLESLHAPGSPTSSASDGSSPPQARLVADQHGGNAARTVVLGLAVLSSLLATARANDVPVSAPQTQRLGALAVRLLDDTDADVRKADLEFCLALHEMLGGDRSDGFWRALVGAKEMHLNLITYYLARRGRA